MTLGDGVGLGVGEPVETGVPAGAGLAAALEDAADDGFMALSAPVHGVHTGIRAGWAKSGMRWDPKTRA